MKRLILLLSLSSALLSSPPARAWSAADSPGQNDDSVCDFGGYAMDWIQKTLLQGQAAPIEKFANVTLRHAASKCRNGQILILRDPYGSYDAPGVFDRVSATLCKRSEIQKNPSGGDGIEWRCPITKMNELRP